MIARLIGAVAGWASAAIGVVLGALALRFLGRARVEPASRTTEGDAPPAPPIARVVDAPRRGRRPRSRAGRLPGCSVRRGADQGEQRPLAADRVAPPVRQAALDRHLEPADRSAAARRSGAGDPGRKSVRCRLPALPRQSRAARATHRLEDAAAPTRSRRDHGQVRLRRALLHRQARPQVHRHAGLAGARSRRRGVVDGGLPARVARARHRVVPAAVARRDRARDRRRRSAVARGSDASRGAAARGGGELRSVSRISRRRSRRRRVPAHRRPAPRVPLRRARGVRRHTRPSGIMGPIAAGLEPAAWAGLADYYAARTDRPGARRCEPRRQARPEPQPL